MPRQVSRPADAAAPSTPAGAAVPAMELRKLRHQSLPRFNQYRLFRRVRSQLNSYTYVDNAVSARSGGASVALEKHKHHEHTRASKTQSQGVCKFREVAAHTHQLWVPALCHAEKNRHLRNKTASFLVQMPTVTRDCA